MQVVGTSVLSPVINDIAARSGRSEVAEWASRVLKRHVKREMSLLNLVKSEKGLKSAMAADGLPPEAVARVMEAYKNGEDIYVPSIEAIQAFVEHATDTMDWIESLPSDDRRIRRIERMAWTDAEQQSAAWHESLKKARKNSKGLMDGVVKVMELSNGAFAGELTTKDALAAEGDAMGHCVGGYWNRVSKGEVRIVSIRDDKGHPHVTIELKGPPVLYFEDGTSVSVIEKPRNGVSDVLQSASEWMAVQIRGKQNHAPIKKYQALVDEWLSRSNITEGSERDIRTVLPRHDAKPLRVYSVFDRSFRSLDAALVFAEEKISKPSSSKKGSAFGRAYLQSGLSALHRHLGDSKRLLAFMEDNIPGMLKNLDNLLGSGSEVHQAVRFSGVGILMDSLKEMGADLPKVSKHLFDAAAAIDDKEAIFDEMEFASIANGKSLKVVVHQLPLSPLLMLANGYVPGHEAEAAKLIQPALRGALDRMKKQPDAVHVLKSAKGGVTSQDIRTAFLFCGMGDEYAKAANAVEVMSRGKAKELLRDAKQLRASGKISEGTANTLRNTLSDVFETRLRQFVASKVGGAYLLIAPEPKKDFVLRPSMLEKTPIKTYSMPMR